MILFGLLLALSPLLSGVVSVVQNLSYSVAGADIIANYSVVHSLIQLIRPVFNCSLVLLIVHGAAVIGWKRREARKEIP